MSANEGLPISLLGLEQTSLNAEGLSSAVVNVIFALRCSDTQFSRQRRTRGVCFGMHIQSRLIAPSFQNRKLVGIDDTLKNFKLLAAGLARNFRASSLV